jgi:hypothetical protein
MRKHSLELRAEFIDENKPPVENAAGPGCDHRTVGVSTIASYTAAAMKPPGGARQALIQLQAPVARHIPPTAPVARNREATQALNPIDT